MSKKYVFALKSCRVLPLAVLIHRMQCQVQFSWLKGPLGGLMWMGVPNHEQALQGLMWAISKWRAACCKNIPRFTSRKAIGSVRVPQGPFFECVCSCVRSPMWSGLHIYTYFGPAGLGWRSDLKKRQDASVQSPVARCPWRRLRSYLVVLWPLGSEKLCSSRVLPWRIRLS